MNENSAVTKGTWAAGFSVASVWFGTHVGAGFATGNQVLSYFVNYGWTAVIFPLISMGILAYVIYVIMKLPDCAALTTITTPSVSCGSRTRRWRFRLRSSTSSSSSRQLRRPSTARRCWSWMLSRPSAPGGSTILVAIILIVLCLFGVKLIIAASTILSTGILITAGTMIIVGIANHPDEIGAAFSAGLNNPGEGFWRGVIIYCGFQCVSIPPMIAAAITLNQKGVKRASILGGIMNGGMLALSGLMLLGWKPEIVEAGQTALPNLFICNTIGWDWLVICYSVLLFCAFISTCVTLIYTMILRIDKKFFVKSDIHEKIRMSIIGVVMVAICMSLSFIGISDIITYAYGYDGYLALVAIVIPVIIIGNIKNKKYVKEHPEALTK